MVEDRTERLAPDVQAILGLAAELGDEVTDDLLVAASGADPDTVLDALDEGLGVDPLVEQAGRYRFGHPLFRAALRRAVPRGSRAMPRWCPWIRSSRRAGLRTPAWSPSGTR